MDLSPSPEQRLLVESARAFLARTCPIEHVRAMQSDDRGFDPGHWRQMAALGWPGLALPGELEGSGQTFLDLALLLEEAGRVLLPGPLLVTCAVAAPLLLACEDGEERRRCLRAIAAGRGVVTLALLEPGARDEWQDATLEARRDGEAIRLRGIKRLVPFAPHADVVLVTAELPGEGACVLSVPNDAPGASFRRQRVLGLDPSYEMRFDGVCVPPGALIACGAGASAAIESASLHAAVASLAYLAGAAARALEMTVEYANTRVQFGRPIGGFQAVAHRCVDMLSDVEALRYLVYQAAWSLAAGNPSEIEAGAAKAYGNEALRRIFANAQQVHGAIGFSTEYDLQLFTRRAKAAELQWGSTAAHRERVAKAMGL